MKTKESQLVKLGILVDKRGQDRDFIRSFPQCKYLKVQGTQFPTFHLFQGGCLHPLLDFSGVFSPPVQLRGYHCTQVEKVATHSHTHRAESVNDNHLCLGRIDMIFTFLECITISISAGLWKFDLMRNLFSTLVGSSN